MIARRSLTQPGVVLPLPLLAGQAGLLVLSPILVEVAEGFDISTAAAGQLRTVTGLVAGAATGGIALVLGGYPLPGVVFAGLLVVAALLYSMVRLTAP